MDKEQIAKGTSVIIKNSLVRDHEISQKRAVIDLKVSSWNPHSGGSGFCEAIHFGVPRHIDVSFLLRPG